MSSINPRSESYDTPDALRIAKDISWVIRTLWGGAVVLVLAAVGVAALASDVRNNTQSIKGAATKEQMEFVITTLTELKQAMKESDIRQRDIKTQLSTVASDVEHLKDKQ